MKGIRLRLASSGGGRNMKTGRLVKHKQAQANKLRQLAARHEQQAIKALKRRNTLLELAAKLDEQCSEPTIKEVAEKPKFGF